MEDEIETGQPSLAYFHLRSRTSLQHSLLEREKKKWTIGFGATGLTETSQSVQRTRSRPEKHICKKIENGGKFDNFLSPTEFEQPFGSLNTKSSCAMLNDPKEVSPQILISPTAKWVRRM